MVFLQLILMLFFVTNCTGIHYFSNISNVANTNPAQDYGKPSITNKGGGILHAEKVVGQIGNAKVEKIGEACSYSILWLFAGGDSSINTARKIGNINKIALVEYEITAFLGFLYNGFCIRVSGE